MIRNFADRKNQESIFHGDINLFVNLTWPLGIENFCSNDISKRQSSLIKRKPRPATNEGKEEKRERSMLALLPEKKVPSNFYFSSRLDRQITKDSCYFLQINSLIKIILISRVEIFFRKTVLR